MVPVSFFQARAFAAPIVCRGLWCFPVLLVQCFLLVRIAAPSSFDSLVFPVGD